MHESKNVQHVPILASIMVGLFKLEALYTSPETLLRDRQWRSILDSPVIQRNLVGLVIDEARCVKSGTLLLCTSVYML